MPRIEITIDSKANVKVEAQEIKGSGCAELTKAIEKAIGQTTNDVKKPEFHQGTSNVINNAYQN